MLLEHKDTQYCWHDTMATCSHIKLWSSETITQLLKEVTFCDFTFYNAGRLPFLWESLVISATKGSGF